jgi:hypothetical protein
VSGEAERNESEDGLALFLSDCIISAFGRDSRTFERPGHNSRLLLLSRDDIDWQVVRAIIAATGNAFLRLACSR